MDRCIGNTGYICGFLILKWRITAVHIVASARCRLLCGNYIVSVKQHVALSNKKGWITKYFYKMFDSFHVRIFYQILHLIISEYQELFFINVLYYFSLENSILFATRLFHYFSNPLCPNEPPVLFCKWNIGCFRQGGFLCQIVLMVGFMFVLNFCDWIIIINVPNYFSLENTVVSTTQLFNFLFTPSFH